MKLYDYCFTEDELKKIIIEEGKYFAHLSIDSEEKESLIEHTLLVQKYFFKLIENHKLEKIINLLINRISNEIFFKEFIKELFVKAIVFHDFGKVNPEFQNRKMNNKVPGFKHNLSSNHSLISGYFFSLYCENLSKEKNCTQKQETFIDFLCLVFSYPILKHHSSNLENIKNDLLSLYNENKIDNLVKFKDYFSCFTNVDFIKEINEFVFKNIEKILIDDLIYQNINDKFSFYALLKLNYSLLTASDYLATTHFMNNWNNDKTMDFGVFDINLKKKIIKHIEKSTEYNKKIYDEINNYKFEFPTKVNNINLNKLRQNLAVEVINNIKNNADKNLFYLEAPTGSGKTNLSMLAIAEFLRNDIENKENNITKVFYVFPFTTLITQTFDSLKRTLGLDDNEIVQIHSKAGFSQKDNDNNYGSEKENIIDYLFVNYPVSLLSHIKFFDILKSNDKIANYLLHRLANSIVIIDELQTYSPKEWDKVIYFIKNYADLFNIKFILMSATLPKIDKLLSDKNRKLNFDEKEFISLIENKDSYFNNDNFKERVSFDISMLKDPCFNKENKEDFLNKLWKKLELESKKYMEQNGTVHTIIEFIFKKTASSFRRLADDMNDLFDEVLLLSGTILESRRKEIISKLKSDSSRLKNILLITTQVVEAGVDIDMDLGFKDTSLIDSDEQLAGRINRNVNKLKCKLFLFDYDDESVIYGKDYRYEQFNIKFKNEYHSILKNKKIDLIYDSVMDYKNSYNTQLDYADNLPEYLRSIKKLDFNSVNDKFKLIDNHLLIISVYVPIDIKIRIIDSEKNNFTDSELLFLKKKNKYKDESFVSGEKIWELYCEIIENKDTDFTQNRINQIIMQGLISKFSFSINKYSKSFNKIVASGYGEEKYGFYKLNNVEKVYDYETGLVDLNLEDINFW